MYGKLFESMFDGTLAKDWEALVVFQQMVILCDADGQVDITPYALHRRTGIPIDIIERGIAILVAPDKQSRSSSHEGRRLMPLDPTRDWGWVIVNHDHYRRMVSAFDKRQRDKERIKRKRDEPHLRGVPASNEPHLRGVPASNDESPRVDVASNELVEPHLWGVSASNNESPRIVDASNELVDASNELDDPPLRGVPASNNEPPRIVDDDVGSSGDTAKHDKTKRGAVDDVATCRKVSQPVASCRPVSRSVANVAHTDTDTDTDTDTRLRTHSTSIETIDGGSLFDQFWSVVHRKTAKTAARKAWPRACRDVVKERGGTSKEAGAFIVSRMEAFAASSASRPTDHSPIHPSTWLNQGRYFDDVDDDDAGSSDGASLLDSFIKGGDA